MEEKTYVNDIDRSIYDIRNEETDVYRIEEGLKPEIVEQISKEKKDPLWMELFRLKSLQIYNNMRVPDWGPPEGLDMSHIATYVRPNTKMKTKYLMCRRRSRIPSSVWESPGGAEIPGWRRRPV